MSKWRPANKNCIYVIPDIHGNVDLFHKICDRILPLRENKESADQLVILGDYIDRHPDSHKVIDLCIELQKNYPSQVTCLMGNHELMLLAAMDRHPNRKMSLAAMTHQHSLWLKVGGDKTLRGYLDRAGIDEPRVSDFPRFRIVDVIPPEHLEFFSSLKKFHRIGDYLFVHGGLNPEVEPEKQELEVLVSDRSLCNYVLATLGQPSSWEKPIIVTGHNHTRTHTPIITDNFLMLDCGSPHQLLVTELTTMQAFMAYPGFTRMVNYPLEETVSHLEETVSHLK